MSDGKENTVSEGIVGQSASTGGLGGGCARIALVVAIHDLASHFENALYAFRDDAEGLLKAKRDIAWARKTAAQHNYNGTGCKEPPNKEVRGAEQASPAERPSSPPCSAD